MYCILEQQIFLPSGRPGRASHGKPLHRWGQGLVQLAAPTVGIFPKIGDRVSDSNVVGARRRQALPGLRFLRLKPSALADGLLWRETVL